MPQIIMLVWFQGLLYGQVLLSTAEVVTDH